jgi:hypothetical protein
MAQLKGPFFRRDRHLSLDDPYRDPAALPEPALCERCGALWRGGRWVLAGQIPKRELRFLRPAAVVCPACRRTADAYPAGVVYLSGGFLAAHREQILRTLRNEEAASRARNPLDRIMGIEAGDGRLTVTTTSEKLAQRLGKAVCKSCGGDLDIRFSHQEKLTRVYWSREASAPPRRPGRA